ncbi:hypothetical protein [Natronospora cellulosivora (SeqCode)]
MDIKKIIKKAIPFIIAIEIIYFTSSFQQLGFGIIIGALLVEIINFKQLSLNSMDNKEESLEVKDFQEIKLSKDMITYNNDIVVFIEELKSQITNFTDSKYYRESARLALNQLLRVVEKFETFKNILDVKFDQEELSYNKFMSVTEDVYYNILENLERVKNVYQSIDDINVKYIDSRIDTLEKKSDLSKEMTEELLSLRNKKDMLINELNSVDKYISINEKAITDIDNMKIKLGSLKTSSNQSKREFERSLAELRTMAKRINDYSA